MATPNRPKTLSWEPLPMRSDSTPRRLKCSFATIVLAAMTILLVGCTQPDEKDKSNETSIQSEAKARTVVTDNVRLIFPGTSAITPQNATLTPCSNYHKNAIGEGPPWSVDASELLARPEQIAEAIKRIDTLAESGYRLRPPGPLRTFPEERVYEDERGVTIGISATKLPDSVYFSVFSSTPCTIDGP